jgi:hypothetical protein
MVVLASPDESEELDLLKDRGCPIWHMAAGEVLIGEGSASKRARASLVGATIRAADIRRRTKVSTVDCRDDLLEATAAALERAAEMIADREEESEAEEALGRLFTILFECSECCFEVSAGTASDLEAVREHVTRHARWMEPVLAETLREAIGGLEHTIGNSAGQQKADAFLRILTEHNGQWAVAARSPRTAERLREGLDRLGLDLPVMPVSAMSPDHEFSGILVPAWPNDQRFTRIKNLSVAAEICVLAYPFESKWVVRHQARERARVRSNRMQAEERSSILGIEPRLLSGLNGAGSEAEKAPPKEIMLDLPVFRLEARVAQRRVTQPPAAVDGEDHRGAQLIQFFGGCYALLTEWAELPVLNELLDKSVAGKAKLASATAFPSFGWRLCALQSRWGQGTHKAKSLRRSSGPRNTGAYGISPNGGSPRFTVSAPALQRFKGSWQSMVLIGRQ